MAASLPSFGANSFQDHLQLELVRRCRSNPRYSLRAFARSLNIEPSLLSKLLSGKRRLTLAMFERLSKQLALPIQDLKSFRASLLNSPSSMHSPHYERVSSDSFALISDWYHYAILELAQTNSFKPDTRWIARRLDISQPEAKDALDRLQRLGYLEMLPDGEIRLLSGNHTTVGSTDTSTALRMFQRRALEKAMQTLDEVPSDCRDHTTMTMAIALKDLPKAKELIKQFRRSFCRKMQIENKSDEVFQIAISFYPLTSLTSSHAQKGSLP